MKLVPLGEGLKDVSRKLAHARDMDQHIREAYAEAPIALAEQIDAARMLEHGITKERLPFVYGWHRLIVSAPTEELLQQRVDAVVEHYRDLGIDIVCSTGDQFSLFCESLPGDRIRVNAYAQRQPLRTIAGGMPTATVDLGDRLDQNSAGWVGPYIGETLGRARSVVHFDPLVAAARNRPTAVAITGEPGGGKTTLALLLIYQMALRGVTVAAIDPKGDAESLVELLRRPRTPRPGAAARFGRAGPARPVQLRRRPRRQEDHGHRDAPPAPAAHVGGARVGDDPGRGRGGQPAAALARQGRRPSRRLRRSGVEEPRCRAALDVGDAARAAVLRPVRWRAHRHGRVDDGVHPRRPDPARRRHQPRRLLLRAAAVGRVDVPRLTVRATADARPRPAPAEGHLPRRGMGDHPDAGGRQADPRSVTYGAIPEHRLDSGLTERRGPLE